MVRPETLECAEVFRTNRKGGPMPHKNHIPSYRLHKQSGQAIVTLPDGLGGRCDVLLGRFGIPESRAEYARVLAEWETQGRRLATDDVPQNLTINELILAFWQHAEKHYDAAGRELENFRHSLRPLKKLYGHTHAAAFGPKALKTIQQAMATGNWMTPEEKMTAQEHGRPIGWCRNVVNRRITRIKTVFRWAESEELVPASTLHALQTVRGLPKGRGGARQTKKVEPATWDQLQSILPYCTSPVEAMLLIQWWSGMRSCEVRIIRTIDIDQNNPDCWLYRPFKHKNDWRETEQERIIPLGPQCIQLLRSWLRPDDPMAFLFRPQQAEANRNALRRALRQTPMTPSQKARQPKKLRKRAPGTCYSVTSYAHAVARACVRENVRRTADQGMTVRERYASRIRLHPYQCRHAAKRRITRSAGLDAARAVLGQKSLGSTNLYANQLDVNKAAEVMTRLG
jgi:integrase